MIRPGLRLRLLTHLRPCLRPLSRLRPLPALALLAALLAGPAAPALVAQEDEDGETAIERALRDQTRVGLRLKSLREKMERLAQRYEDEGRTRNATLLRSALAAMDEQKLLDLADQVELSLEQSNLSTVEQQDALASGLEGIFALLRDRKDADELARQADLAREALAELDNLASNERRLLAATRATSDRKDDLTRQALDQAAQLDRALDAAEGATASLQAADQALGEAELAAQLAAQQRALAGEAQPAPSIQKLLEEALAMLRAQLDRPLEGGGVGDELLTAAEQSRAESRRSAAQAAERMQAASAELARLEAGRQSAGATGAPRAASGEQPGEQPGEPSGGQTGDASGEQAGEQPGERGGDTPSDSGGEPGEQGEGEPREPSDAGEEAAGEAGEAGEPGEAGEDGEDGGESGSEPRPSQPGASQPPADPRYTAAKEEMEAAARALDEVTRALERSERSLTAARNRARASALASSEQSQAAGESLEELAQRLEAVSPEDGPELLDRTRKLLDELRRAAEAQRAGQSEQASAAQSAAQLSLAELLAQLQQMSQTAGDSERPPPTPQALEELAQRQDELQRRVHELMQRLSELPDQSYQESASQAGESMGSASSSLRSGDTAQAGRKEEQAAEQLEQAARQLSGAARNYEQLRQDELLFRVGESLRALLERQEKVSTETRELDVAAAGAERLSRSQRRTVVRLSDEERDLATSSESVRTTLADDGAAAFAFALERCRDDLTSASDLLADEQTGELVQSLQDDVCRQLQDLLAVLDAEVERRRDAEKVEMPEGTQQNAQPALVPPVAELLLIQRMEQAALARLENFVRLNPVDQEDGLGPVERQLLQRWAAEHVKVSELFEEMIPKAGGPQIDGAVPDGATPEKESGQ